MNCGQSFASLKKSRLENKPETLNSTSAKNVQFKIYKRVVDKSRHLLIPSKEESRVTAFQITTTNTKQRRNKQINEYKVLKAHQENFKAL
jgi:hypothetical protein